MKLFGWELRRVPVAEAAPEPPPPPLPPPASASTDATAFLSPALRRREPWPFPSADAIRAELLGQDVGRLWQTIPHGHKWLSYFDVYEKVFAPLRGRAPRILEIGVDRGGSLDLWQRYFGPGTWIVGVDINPDCARFARPEQGVHVRIGSQDDPDFLAAIVEELGPFDLIIDDGSHVTSHQIASFNALFDRGLVEGGLYFVEDLETSYWGHRTGQLDTPVTFLDFAKAVVDEMHDPYRHHDYPAFRIEAAEGTAIEGPRIARIVEEVRIFDSVVVFTRRTRLPPVVEYLP